MSHAARLSKNSVVQKIVGNIIKETLTVVVVQSLAQYHTSQPSS